MASLKEIAERCGVSPATVSRVLNDKGQVHPDTRQQVLQAARDVGYLSPHDRGGVRRIAVVYPGPVWVAQGSPYDMALIQGAARAMAELDFNLTIVDLRRPLEGGETYAGLLRRQGVTGAILRADDSILHLCERIADEGFPSVMIGERSDNPHLSYIDCNSLDASREAVEHLIGLGHRRIAMCVNNILTSDHRDRIEGWRRALEAHGLPADEGLIIRLVANRENGGTLLRHILSMSSHPTAAFVADPNLAAGAIQEAHGMGVRIPAELSIIGVDDSDIRFWTVPQMTSVCQDAGDLGRRAVGLLRRMVETDDPGPIRIATSAWFEVRGTTAPPRDTGPKPGARHPRRESRREDHGRDAGGEG